MLIKLIPGSGRLWRRLARAGAISPAILALVACAATQQPPAPPAPLPGAALTAAPAQPDLVKFAAFMSDFRAEAIKAGIRPEIYDRSMAGLTPNAHIFELDGKQPEFVRPVWEYLDGAVSGLRVKSGQQQLAAYSTALANLESRYGVPKEILVAIWGIESDYGVGMGHYNMFQALATLGYDGRRTALGRRELLAALKMEQREGYTPEEMTSSWAGAFGQTQFMPSTFLAHAVDGDGDGKIDLWHSVPDALASTAAMLAGDGWQKGAPWFIEVHLPADFPYAEADLEKASPVSHWRGLGVTAITGTALPDTPEKGAILLPAGASGPAFLVYANFKCILHYNNAAAYALAVGQLANRFAGGSAILHPWPRNEQTLNRDEAIAFQRDLKTLGYDPGDIDGILGGKVKSALRDYQRAKGLIPDGFATLGLLQKLESEIAAKPR